MKYKAHNALLARRVVSMNFVCTLQAGMLWAGLSSGDSSVNISLARVLIQT